MEPVDQVLDVLGRVLLAHQTGDRELELTAIDHDSRRGREAVVLAGVIDVQMGVQDPADVAGRQVVFLQLVIELHLLGHVAGHAQPLHDLGMARSGVDDDRLVAKDQEPERRDLRTYAHVAPEYEEARLDVDVDEAQKLDLEGHAPLLSAVGDMRTGIRPAACACQSTLRERASPRSR